MDIGILGQGDLHEGVVLLFAQDDANGRGFIFGLHIAVEVVDIHLHLAEVLMGQLADFQVDQHVAAKQAVVEDQIDKEVVFVEGEPLLPGLEEKAFPEFQQKVFKLVDDGGFEIGFGIPRFFIKPKEFQHIGFFEKVLRVGDGLSFSGQFADSFLVPAQRQPFIEAGIELAFEFRRDQPFLAASIS